MALVACLCTVPSAAQVQVSVRTAKPSFLAGEPVLVVVDVKNVGEDPVAYGGGIVGQPITLSVPQGRRKAVPRLSGCSSGGGSGGGAGMVDHPPLLKPGASTSFRYLLRGYRLEPGTYELRVEGQADVRWKQYPDRPPLKHKERDAVEGAVVNRTLGLSIVPSTGEQLEAAYAPYAAVLMQFYSEEGRDAASAILEMAPRFLEKQIVQFIRFRGNDWWTASRGAAALGEIGTPSSRQELIDWFDRSESLHVRSAIVDAAARTGDRRYLEFLASLLPGRSAVLDDHMRRTAALGIGLIGGDDAVAALRAAPASSNELVEGSILEALGNTRSRLAVPAIIDRAVNPKGHVRSAACSALIALTHRTWCDGTADVAAVQARWRGWWARAGATAPLYGVEHCEENARYAPIR